MKTIVLMTTDQNEPDAINATLKAQRARLTVDFKPNTITLGIDFFSRLFISFLFLVNKIEFGAFIGWHIGLFLLEIFVFRYTEDELKKRMVKDLKPEYNQHIQDYVPVITLPLHWLDLYMITGLLATPIVFIKNSGNAATRPYLFTWCWSRADFIFPGYCLSLSCL